MIDTRCRARSPRGRVSRPPVPGVRLSNVAWACFLVALLLAARPARPLERFDFEGPYLVDPGYTLKDHCLFRVGNVWHAFYIRGTEDTGTISERELGHATSTDLRNWNLLGPVIEAGPDAWESRNVWAPTVLTNPNGGGDQYTMLYTGANNLIVQRMGMATCSTSSLGLWIKYPANPVLQPVGEEYLWDETLTFSAFRDPFVFKVGNTHHLLHTVVLEDLETPAGRRGAVHHATSQDFLNWTEQPPLMVHNGPTTTSWHELESVQLHQAQGYWHFFYTEQNEQGIRYLRSTEMDSGWDFNAYTVLDLGTAAEVTPDGGDRYLFSRHTSNAHAGGDSLFWVIRVDSLQFDNATALPEVLRYEQLDADWPIRTGTAFIAAPTFGDNPVERGDPSANLVGHGFLSSTEFYAGPLSGYGSPGSQLGGGATGTMKSRTFTLTGEAMSLRVGGGNRPNCFIALMDAVADTAIYEARGTGSLTMQPVTWDLRNHQGREVYLWIEDQSMESDGFINVDHIVEVDVVAAPAVPTVRHAARILPNVPNPFNPSTRVRFSLEQPAEVELRILDARGRLVRRYPVESLPAGVHERPWHGRDQRGQAVASGVYQLLLFANGEAAGARPLTLVR